MTEKHARTRNASQAGGLTDLTSEATRDIGGALASLLADVFALYVKTKNFHWHMSGPHFRDYHLMLDEQSDQIFAMTDPIAEKSLARSAARRYGPSAISHVCSAFPTTTRNMLNHTLCLPS